MTGDLELDRLLELGQPLKRAESAVKANALIIHEHYRNIGAQRYDGERFRRLCAAWNEQPVEMAARIGMDAPTLLKRLDDYQFGTKGCYAEAILLHQLERFISWHLTGHQPKGELFPAPLNK